MGKRLQQSQTDARRYEAARALMDMRAGAYLQLSEARGARGWKINGRTVGADAVAIVLNEKYVTPSLDGLFPDYSQTYYWAGPA